MTSSFLIREKLREKKEWSFGVGDGQSTLGDWDDTYLRPYGECHPDFKAIPIGNPYGVKMCVRRTVDGQRIGVPLEKAEEKLQNGYQRGSVNLYRPQANLPTQDWNPQFYQDRRMPYEQDLLRADYQRWPTRYNGTGMELMHAPAELRDRGHPYHQYGYSDTPKEGQHGLRSDSNKVNLPETKYDVTRGQQAYPLWRGEQSYLGNFQSQTYDRENQRRIV